MAKSAYYVWKYDPKTRVVTKSWNDKKDSVLDLSKLDEDTLYHAAFHGAKQKGDDCHAGGIEKFGSVAGMREQTDAVFAAIAEGIWNRQGEGFGGAKFTRFEILVDAIAALRFKGNKAEAEKAMEHLRPIDESIESDEKKRAKVNQQRASQRRKLADVKAVKDWLVKNGHREKDANIDDLLNFDEEPKGEAADSAE